MLKRGLLTIIHDNIEMTVDVHNISIERESIEVIGQNDVWRELIADPMNNVKLVIEGRGLATWTYREPPITTPGGAFALPLAYRTDRQGD